MRKENPRMEIYEKIESVINELWRVNEEAEKLAKQIPLREPKSAFAETDEEKNDVFYEEKLEQFYNVSNNLRRYIVKLTDCLLTHNNN
jgi:hypothetical protein